MTMFDLKGLKFGEGCCVKCGKPLTERTRVWLELDQRTQSFHDFRDVPESRSQGWFEFGSDCAEKMRKEARSVRSRFQATAE